MQREDHLLLSGRTLLEGPRAGVPVEDAADDLLELILQGPIQLLHREPPLREEGLAEALLALQRGLQRLHQVRERNGSPLHEELDEAVVAVVRCREDHGAALELERLRDAVFLEEKPSRLPFPVEPKQERGDGLGKDLPGFHGFAHIARSLPNSSLTAAGSSHGPPRVARRSIPAWPR